MRVIRFHHLADDRSALDVAAVGADVQVMPHRIQDTTLHRLEPIAQVWQCARGDDRKRVIKVARPGRFGEGDILNLYGRPCGSLAQFPTTTAVSLRHRSFSPGAHSLASDAIQTKDPEIF